MATIPRPTLNRIPGGGGEMPLAKKETHIKDLTKMTRMELLEIRDREAKLLSNKAKLQKLPDKGKRIQDLHDRVVAEINRRYNVEEAAKLFSDLNIASTGQKTLNELEWHGRLQQPGESRNPFEDVLDSDDETDMDPLRIIAQKQMHERKVKVESEDPKLITEADIKEIESFKMDTAETNNNVIEAELVAIDIKDKLQKIKPKIQTLNHSLNSSHNNSRSSSAISQQLELDPHVHYLVEKTETNIQPDQKEKFRPYRTTVSNVHDPAKERERKKPKNWEITAATPPALQHNGTQLLTLMDSVEIQAEYLLKLKELQEKQAAARLAAKMKRLCEHKIQLPTADVLKSNPSFTTYRSNDTKKIAPQTHHIEGSQAFNEDDEVHDPLDEDKASGVNYTVYD